MAGDKLTSPGGEEFQLADEALRRLIVQGAPAVLTERTGQLWAAKEGDLFLYADGEGNLNPATSTLAGLYHADTRFLSELILLLDGLVPLRLSTSTERGFTSHVDLSNQDIRQGDGDLAVLQQTVNVRRTRVVGDRLYERVRVRSYNPGAVSLRLTMTFGADFADIFEVRGLPRATRGKAAVPKADAGRVVFAYAGVDGRFRETRVTFERAPSRIEVRGERVVASWKLDLRPGATEVVGIAVEPRLDGAARPDGRFDTATNALRRSYEAWDRGCTTIATSNPLFDGLVERGRRDLRALRTPTPRGQIVAAGIPWYVAPRGRDALLTGHAALMLNPGLAHEALTTLAAYQGRVVDDWRDEEPGKIFQELRQGELAGTGEIPHTPYYGSVDATPLWLLLLGTWWRWSGDLAAVRALLPAAERALVWLDTHGDRDGDGFVEYERRSPRGLLHHGWRHTHDAVVHADGSPARGPIALAEVQAYAYLAKLRVADVYAALGDRARATTLRAQAEQLRRRFDEAFWMEAEGYYALALDGDKRQVATVTSNPGHALYCAIVPPERARLVARRMLAPDMFSGWGIRTMSRQAVAYNPMSYHNGSVWPHDNALIAAGLKRYGHVDAADRVATAIFEMAVADGSSRLPELFCGFTRRAPNRPVAHPMACAPQAWSAAAPFLLLQAMLGLSANAPDNVVTVNKPHLPPWLDTVELRNLRVGRSRLSLLFHRQGGTTGFSLLDRDGDVRVLMEE